MGRVELHLPPDVAYVGLARHVVTVAARQAGMDDERVEDLKIAVSEATTNAILSHGREQRSAPVVLGFRPSQGAFEVEVSDAGGGSRPPEEGTAESTEWSTEGGLGATIIRGLADAVELIRGEDMTVGMRFSVGLSGTAAASSEP